MESPEPKKAPNLEDSGCVVEGLRSALYDGDAEDENSSMVRLVVNYTPFYSFILMLNLLRARGVHMYERIKHVFQKQSKRGHKFSAKHLIASFQRNCVS